MAIPSAGLRSGPEDQSRRLVSAAWLTGSVALGYLLLFGAVALVRVHEIGKPISYDTQNYQYYSGFAEIHGFGSPIALAGQLETYIDAQLNVVYYLLITHLSPRLAVSAIAGLQSLSVSALAFLVWRLARGVTQSRAVAPLAGLLAGAGALFSPIYVGTTGQTGSDALLALPLFVAVALLYQVLVSPRAKGIAWRNTVVAGLLLGVTGELKFTEASYSTAIFAGFAVAVLLARSRAGWTYRRCAILVGTVGLTALVVAVALYLPQALVLWHRYHDPFFPFFNGIFHSPYLLPKSYNPGYAATTPASVWSHFSRLLVGGRSTSDGMFLDLTNFGGPVHLDQVKSPVLFFGLVITLGMLVVDVIRRDKAEAVFLEISVLLGFVLWDVVFGYYRYLAPMEMAAGAVVIVLLLLHRELYHPAALLGVACALVVGIVSSQPARPGHPDAFGSSYFAVPPNTFSDMRGAGVVLVGAQPLGFLVADLPSDTDVVRSRGSLEQVMTKAWWEHVARTVDSIQRPWWVVFDAPDSRIVSSSLRLVGLSGSFYSCRGVRSATFLIEVCRATA